MRPRVAAARMRLLPVVLLPLCLALVLPSALAASIPPHGEKSVGPCTLSWSWMQPGGGSHTSFVCAAADQEIVAYESGSRWGGPYCELRVAGVQVYVCP